MDMKILSFGHIPSWAGGRQNSGLANVIYQLAKNMSNISSVSISLVATDVYNNKFYDGNLHIIGWSKFDLVKCFFRYFYTFSKYLKFLLIHCSEFSISNLVNYLFKGVHLFNNIKQNKPDVVHLHGAESSLFLSLIPNDIKIIVTLHGIVGNDPNIPNYSNFKSLEYKCLKSTKIDMLYFISKSLVHDFEMVYGSIIPRNEIILNAYDNNIYKYIEPINNKPFITLCTVGSIQARKGQFRVLEGILKSDVNIKYICIGNGNENEINDLISFSSSNRISFEYCGVLKPSEIRRKYSEVDYMILPSSSEGFGLVYLEAIACGVPVILPKNLPIVQEEGMIRENLNSILLDDCSSDSIARCIISLKDLNFNRNDVAKTIVDYSWSNIADKYIKSINNIL